MRGDPKKSANGSQLQTGESCQDWRGLRRFRILRKMEAALGKKIPKVSFRSSKNLEGSDCLREKKDALVR